jgi:hypothetical protein
MGLRIELGVVLEEAIMLTAQCRYHFSGLATSMISVCFSGVKNCPGSELRPSARELFRSPDVPRCAAGAQYRARGNPHLPAPRREEHISGEPRCEENADLETLVKSFQHVAPAQSRGKIPNRTHCVRWKDMHTT